MNYYVTRDDMQKKVDRAIQLWDGLYTFDDIIALIKEGKMQSHVHGDTWIITQVNEFPQRKVLEITCVIGNMEEAVAALPEIYEYARSLGITRVTALGREGWWKFRDAGWNKAGIMYAKEL